MIIFAHFDHCLQRLTLHVSGAAANLQVNQANGASALKCSIRALELLVYNRGYGSI